MVSDVARRFSLGISLILSAIIYIGCAVRLAGMGADDSFIHRRIAHNLLVYGQPYFNLNERVMVTSSPLWTVMLAMGEAFHRNGNPVPAIEFVFVLAASVLAYLVVGRMGRGALTASQNILALVAFWCVFFSVLPSSIEQMETACAVALILAGVLGLFDGLSWGMPFLVLACFTRYECFPLLAVAVIYVTLQRLWSKASLFTAATLLVVGFGWLLHEYGTLVPNTIKAKSRLYSGDYLGTFQSLIGSYAQGAGVLIFFALWWLYGRDRSKSSNLLAGILGGFGIFLAAAYLLRKTHMFAWYFPLFLVPMAVAILLATNTETRKKMALGALCAGVILAHLVGKSGSYLLGAVRGVDSRTALFGQASRVHEYEAVGRALYSQCPSSVLMAAEIGGLGWGFPGRIIDGAGLASPEAIQYHPMPVPQERSSGSVGEIPPGLVVKARPDLIVSYDMFAESALPAARRIGYTDYSFPGFIRPDRLKGAKLWGIQQIHVLVAPGDACSQVAVNQAVATAIEN